MIKDKFVHGGVALALVAAGVTAVGLTPAATAVAGSMTASEYVPITPCRLFDTRSGAEHIGTRAKGLGPAESAKFAVWGKNGNCDIPSNATGIATNATAVNPDSASYVTIYPADAPRPTASNLNVVAGGAPTPNQVTVGLSADGAIAAYNNGGNLDLIVDIVGYYQPATSGGGTVGPKGDPGEPGEPGQDGTSMRTGDGVLGDDVGIDGDTFLDEVNGDLYVKQAGAWTLVGNMKGRGMLHGTGLPTADQGQTGDAYVDIANGNVFTKTGSTTWMPENVSLKGAAGQDANASGTMMLSGYDTVVDDTVAGVVNYTADGCLQITGSVTAGSIFLPIDLPVGRTIRSANLRYEDTAANSELRVQMVRSTAGAANETTISDNVVSVNNSNGVAMSGVPAAGVPIAVNNAYYAKITTPTFAAGDQVQFCGLSVVWD